MFSLWSHYGQTIDFSETRQLKLNLGYCAVSRWWSSDEIEFIKQFYFSLCSYLGVSIKSAQSYRYRCEDWLYVSFLTLTWMHVDEWHRPVAVFWLQPFSSGNFVNCFVGKGVAFESVLWGFRHFLASVASQSIKTITCGFIMNCFSNFPLQIKLKTQSGKCRVWKTFFFLVSFRDGKQTK